MKRTYLDYAAATPMSSSVVDAMRPYFSDKFYNPSATYLASRDIKQTIQEKRAAVANWLGARPAEIIFTAGATEANNLAIQGVMRTHPNAEILVSSIEHESVIAPAKLFSHREIPVTPKGIVDLHKLEKMISNDTLLVSVMMVNNELGTIQPLREISKIIKNINDDRLKNSNSLPLYLHSDAAQAGAYLDIHTSRLGVDLMSINGGKIYGPKQSGALYVRAGINLQPLIYGGGQEMGLRSGTENVAGIVGLAAALNEAQENKKEESLRVSELKKLFEGQLQQNIPVACINGSTAHRSPHIVSVTIPGYDNERLMMQMDEAGIQCAVGSACSASREEASHVLSAIGLSDDMARSTLRFSFGRPTTKRDIEKTIEALLKITGSNR